MYSLKYSPLNSQHFKSITYNPFYNVPLFVYDNPISISMAPIPAEFQEYVALSLLMADIAAGRHETARKMRDFPDIKLFLRRCGVHLLRVVLMTNTHYNVLFSYTLECVPVCTWNVIMKTYSMECLRNVYPVNIYIQRDMFALFNTNC